MDRISLSIAYFPPLRMVTDMTAPATKQDLANLEKAMQQEFATKADMYALEGRMYNKFDEAVDHMNRKFDEAVAQMKLYFDVVHEKFRSDLETINTDAIKDHSRRLVRLEVMHDIR